MAPPAGVDGVFFLLRTYMPFVAFQPLNASQSHPGLLKSIILVQAFALVLIMATIYNYYYISGGVAFAFSCS